MPSPGEATGSLPWVDDESLVLRTDFTDDSRWEAAKAAMQVPSDPDGFLANVTFVDDARFADLASERLVELATESWRRQHMCLFVADSDSLTSTGWPVLYLELHGEQRGRSFRVIASELWAVENNLSLANMDFDEFAENTDPDGVYRGF